MKKLMIFNGGSVLLLELAVFLLVSGSPASAQPGSVGAWNGTSSLPYPVDGLAAVAFQGRIYVFGGYANPQGVTPYLANAVYSAVVNSDGSLQNWQSTTAFAAGRRWHAAALNPLSGTVYIIGGCTSTSTLNGTNDVQYARITSGGVGAWASTTPLPSGISGHSAFCYDNYLYVFRGNDQFGGAAQGYYYAQINSDGSLGAWRQGTLSFPVRRYFGTFAFNDHFYLLGGNNGSSTAFNNVYSTRVPQRSSLSYLQMNETEYWNDTAPFQVARWYQGTANANGYAYISGGYTTIGSGPDRSDVQYAQILNDGSMASWNTTTPLPTTLGQHVCVISGLNNSLFIYAIGGDKTVGYGFQPVATVFYAPILSSYDTTPPKTQVSPAAGQQPFSPVAVALMATDVGGSGVVSINRTTDGTDPRTSGTAIVSSGSFVSFSLPIPATLKFSATDAAGNVELPQTAVYSVQQPPQPNTVRFRWPATGPITQDFFDDVSGLGGGVFYDDLNTRFLRKSGDPNTFLAKSRTWTSGVGNPNYLHRGVDIAPPAGGEVRAALTGKATRYDQTDGSFYGNRVVIDHGNGYYSLYAHMADGFAGKIAQISNRQSVDVSTSDLIGHVGKTGSATGYHVHFEIRHSGDAVGYAQEAHFIPVPNSLSVVVGTEIPFDYPGLGGSTLSLALVNSGGLNDSANTTPTVSASGGSVGFKNSPTFHLVDLSTGSVEAENTDGEGTLGNGELFSPVFSADFTVKAFASDDANLVANDSNGAPDVFVWTQTNGVTERVSVSSAGEQANGASYDVGISADGRFVVFTSVATNLIANDTNCASDIFVRDRATNQTYLVSMDSNGVQGNGPSYSPSISADGRFVAFISEATNLVVGDTNSVADIFVRDTQSKITFLVSRAWNGALANGACRQPSISGDGRYVAYESDASNLVPNDTNGCSDVFLYDTAIGTVQKLSTGPHGEQANGGSHNPRISSYGLRIAFTSDASNLSLNDTNGMPDIFVASFIAPPVLNASLSGRQIELSWPTNAAFFNLETATNLNPSAVWSPVSPTPTSVGDQNVVTNLISGRARFYRLRQ